MNRLRPALHFCQLNQEPYVIKCWLCCHDMVKHQLLLKLQMKRNPGGLHWNIYLQKSSFSQQMEWGNVELSG